jgi:type IV pilus assembly protein PilQ
MDKHINDQRRLTAVVGAIAALALALGGCTTTTPSATTPVTVTADTPEPIMITALSTQRGAETLQVTVEASGDLQYTAYTIAEPPQLVVDMANAELAEDLQPVALAEGLVSDIEPQKLPNQHGARLLMHLREMVAYTIDVQERRLQIALNAMPSQQASQEVPETPAASAPEPSSVPPVTPAVAPVAVSETTTVTAVGFETRPNASVVVVETAGEIPQIRVRQRTEPLRLILDVTHARLSPAKGGVTAVDDPHGIVTHLQTLQQGDNQLVHVIAYLRADAPFEVQQEDAHVRLVITNPPAPTDVSQPGGGAAASPVMAHVAPAVVASEAKPAAQVPTATTPSPTGVAQQPGDAKPAMPSGVPAPLTATTIGKKEVEPYRGEKISLDFQNADIHDILRLIAEVSGLNIITGPEVKGTVTTRMMDVPWDQALDIVLKINGLDRERDGNIIRIAPAQRFIAERQERLQAQKAEVQIEPTVTQIVPVSYSKANDLKANLEKLLSERGSIFVDARTNTMIVTDTQGHIDDMLALVKTLDRQTPQVMIESRIVEASRNFLRDLGIQLGGGTTQTTNKNFPSTVTVEGGVASDNGNFLVDLPAAVATGSGGAISFALAGASTLLNMRLSALETTGHGKIVTNPKIATLDNTEAVIQSGRRIPYETVSNEGTQTEFADASISLRVTPHITADGFINMKIQAAKNEADFANTSANGVPTILTREASTEMLIKDGDTVVIGGLYQRTMQEDMNGVPGLSKIPVLGWLFQQNTSRDNNDELLIFITPRIIKQPEAPMQARAAMSY